MSSISGFLEIQPNELSNIQLPHNVGKHVRPLVKDGHQNAAVSVLQTSNSPESKHFLGLLVLQDTPDEGIKHLQEADLPRSNYTLGIIYLKGLYGQQPNKQLALHYLERSAHAGCQSAKVALGYIYWKGIGGSVASESLAKQFLQPETVMMVNDLSADLLLELQTFAVDHFKPGRVWDSYLLSRQSPNHKKEVAELKLRVADKLIAKQNGAPYLKDKVAAIWGSAKEQFAQGEKLPPKMAAAVTQLGRYHYSQTHAQDAHKAVALWTEAAASDDIQAKYYLGLACCSGKGMLKGKKDLAKGKALLKEAADQGFLPAQTMLNYLEKPAKRAKDQKILAKIAKAKSEELDFGAQPEKHCIAANKRFLNKAWTWLKKPGNWLNMGAALLTTAALVGLVAGVVFLAIKFPIVFGGILAVAAGVTFMGGALLYGFAAGGH